MSLKVKVILNLYVDTYSVNEVVNTTVNLG